MENPVTAAAPTPRPRVVEELEQAVIRFVGDSGDGMQLTGTEFTRAAALAGNDISTLPDFPAEIRAPAGTPAGVSGYQVQFSSKDITTPGDQPDVLVAMNPAGLRSNVADLRDGGVLIANTGAFTEGNLTKAGYKTNPLEDGSLSKYTIYKVDVSKLTSTALADSGLGSKEVGRCKNFFALGLMFWMYSRETAKEVQNIEHKFAKRPELAAANVKAFKAGYYYGETAEIFRASYHVAPAKLKPGKYRNMTGNTATALGFIAASKLSGLKLFMAGYPITPASDILHELSQYKNLGVMTVQAEDEIAAAGMAIGASFGGALAITSTSGPGVSLKGESLSLAVMVELPLVLIDVQRGGPSTGLPTKTEQADLNLALYGRHGESPLPIVAAQTPGDCFHAAIEAARIAVTHMTPVILLTDGYLANGSEPWPIPSVESLPRFDVQFRTDPQGFFPYLRDEKTLARPWAVPGTPGLEHRVGGLEKDFLTGNVSYDPINHERMVKIRAEKVERIADDLPPTPIFGDPSGDLLVIGWGSTYGAINDAVRRSRETGKKVSQAHLRWLNPLPRDLGEILGRFKQVMVPEMNMGQLVNLLRAKYLVDAKGLNKIQGKPFKVAEIEHAIAETLGSRA